MGRYKTPLRFPGGKQKLAPFVKELLVTNQLEGAEYVEPYAGGSGIAIELLIGGNASHIHLNDKCYAVYSFWRSVLDESDEFCRRIRSASLTITEWKRQREILTRQTEFNMIDVGYSMFYLNRCNRSGILSAGVIGGLQQTGRWKIDARFPRSELIKRVEAIASRRAAISVTNFDAEDYLDRYVSKLPKRTLVYCDPPYFRKAERLYLHHYQRDDHRRLAGVIQQVKLPWIVSYDNAAEIKAWYRGRDHIEYGLQYNAACAYIGTEVLFFSPKLRIPPSSVIASIDRSLRKRTRDHAKRR